jgi:hypothetical protein
MENERNNRPTPAQALYLLNSTEVQRKLEQGPGLQSLLSSGRKQPELIEELYLTILSRFPTPDEVLAIEAYGGGLPVKAAQAQKPPAAGEATNSPAGVKPGPLGSLGRPGKGSPKATKAKKRDDWIDVAWSLINSEEFMYRH